MLFQTGSAALKADRWQQTTSDKSFYRMLQVQKQIQKIYCQFNSTAKSSKVQPNAEQINFMKEMDRLLK